MNLGEFQPPMVATGWHIFRVVPSIFPPISIFDRVSAPEDLDAVFVIEAMTNDRLAEEAGELNRVAPDDRVSGPGSTPIMAAFTHINPDGGRFTTSEFGAYYAGLKLDTAIAESRHHREAFLRRTNEPPIDIDMRAYTAFLAGYLHDLRGSADRFASLFHSNDYSAGQVLGTRLRDGGSNGLVYDSVCDEGGTCVAVYRPRCISECRQERHLTYRWDGESVVQVYEKRAYKA